MFPLGSLLLKILRPPGFGVELQALLDLTGAATETLHLEVSPCFTDENGGCHQFQWGKWGVSIVMGIWVK